jgi:hypothetical protein
MHVVFLALVICTFANQSFRVLVSCVGHIIAYVLLGR